MNEFDVYKRHDLVVSTVEYMKTMFTPEEISEAKGYFSYDEGREKTRSDLHIWAMFKTISSRGFPISDCEHDEHATPFDSIWSAVLGGQEDGPAKNPKGIECEECGNDETPVYWLECDLITKMADAHCEAIWNKKDRG